MVLLAWADLAVCSFSFLFRCDTSPFFICAYEVTAVVEPCLHGDIVQIVIRVKKQFLSFVKADIAYVFFAGTPVLFAKQFGEVGITHTAHMSKFLNFQRLPRMRINILKDSEE